LVGSAGEHQPLVIANVPQRLLPARVGRGWTIAATRNRNPRRHLD